MLKVKVLKVDKKGKDKEEVGHFYVPSDADLDWIKKNVPYIIRAAQLMALEDSI